MGDQALYKVVQTALGMPAASSNADIDKQAAFIASKIDIADFKDPAKLDKFIVRFAAQWQASHGNATQNVPRIGLSQSLLTTFDNSLLLSMQVLKGGGR